VNVKKHTANTFGIRYDSARGWGWKVNGTAAEHVNYSGRVNVFSVVVAVIENIPEFLFEFVKLIGPLHFRRLRVRLVLKRGEATFSCIFEEAEVCFEGANDDDAVSANEFAQNKERVIDGRQMRQVRMHIFPRLP
jgi:hypothetical protein